MITKTISAAKTASFFASPIASMPFTWRNDLISVMIQLEHRVVVGGDFLRHRERDERAREKPEHDEPRRRAREQPLDVRHVWGFDITML